MKLSCVIHKHSWFCERHSVFITCVGWYANTSTRTQNSLKITFTSPIYGILMSSVFLLSRTFSRSHSCFLKNMAFYVVYLFVLCIYYCNICEVNVWFLFLFPNVRMPHTMILMNANLNTKWTYHMAQSHNSFMYTKIFIKSSANIFIW